MSKGLAITSMILGILSVLTAMFGYFPLVIGVLAIIFSGIALAKHSEGRGMAIAGLVLGIIGTLFSLFWSLVWTAGIASLAGGA